MPVQLGKRKLRHQLDASWWVDLRPRRRSRISHGEISPLPDARITRGIKVRSRAAGKGRATLVLLRAATDPAFDTFLRDIRTNRPRSRPRSIVHYAQNRPLKPFLRAFAVIAEEETYFRLRPVRELSQAIYGLHPGIRAIHFVQHS